MKTQGGDSFWMAIAGGFSPTQLKKYSKVRGENVKYVKFHHLVSNLKVKRKVGSCLGKKNHPPFPFGSKNFPQKSGFSSKSVLPPPTERLIQENPRSCQGVCSIYPTNPKPTAAPQWPEDTNEERRRFFVPRFACVVESFFFRFFQGTAACTDSMVPISGLSALKNHLKRSTSYSWKLYPSREPPPKKKKKNGTAYEWRMIFFWGGEGTVTWGYIGWGWRFGFASIGADLKGLGDGHVSRMPTFMGLVIFLRRICHFLKQQNNKYINVKEGALTMQVGDFFICSSLKQF